MPAGEMEKQINPIYGSREYNFFQLFHQSSKSCRNVLFYFRLIIGFSGESNCREFADVPRVSYILGLQ